MNLIGVSASLSMGPPCSLRIIHNWSSELIEPDTSLFGSERLEYGLQVMQYVPKIGVLEHLQKQKHGHWHFSSFECPAHGQRPPGEVGGAVQRSLDCCCTMGFGSEVHDISVYIRRSVLCWDKVLIEEP